MSTLAPPALAFRRRSTMERLVLDPALEIGAGGEAVVYEVPDDATLVAKVYHRPTLERARKLTLMLANPPRMPEGTAIAWPADLLLGSGGFAGFLMPRAGGPRLFEFYNPVTRRSTAPGFHFGLLHRAGRNLAAAFEALHAAGYVVGDVNESNILVDPVSAAVTLVDADSLQVPDAENGTVFRSHVGKGEFTPPELQGVSFTDVDRAPAHDHFGLAVLLFLLLMEGTHPFAVRVAAGAAEPLPLEDRIRAGMFPYAGSRRGCTPPRLALPFGVVHPAVRALFERCFVDGHLDPSARPAAPEWSDALATAESELRRCDLNPQHRFGAHLGDCPWCERTRLLRGRDPFPATADAARLAPPRARRATAPATAPAPATAAAPRPARPRSAPAPLHTRALGALRHTAADPAVWVFPFLLLAILPLGPGSLLAAVAALALGLLALRPRVTPRHWGRLAAASFAITVAFGHAADLARAPDALDEPYYEDQPPPLAPIPGPNGEGTYDISDVTEPPQLRNRAAVARALERAYPPLLRDAGVGGTTLLQFRVDAEGYVSPESVEVLETTHDQFADAARSVVKRMRFEPARVHGRRVPVRVQIPVTFQPQF